jgi:hypothetical protein
LLNTYLEQGAYTDCFCTELACTVSLGQFVTAFYSTMIFKMERWILTWTVRKSSTDADVAQLAAGSRDHFAAWHVESRRDNELLLTDFLRRTRSWLMIVPIEIDGRAGTRLYFGSAVVPKKNLESGELELGFPFRALLGFHKIYSIALLRAAASRLRAAQRRR